MSNIIKIISTLTFLICVQQAYCQDKMVIDNFGRVNTYYRESTKEIDSLTELPLGVQSKLKKFLPDVLGNLSDSVSFTYGKIITSGTSSDNDSLAFKTNQYTKIKYDLSYKLTCNTIGIKSYRLRIQIDEYGQTLYVNWPTKGYNGKENLKPTEEIQRAALNFAAQKEYVTDNYKVDFMYNSKNDKLCWIFMFEDVRYRDPDIKSYFIIHIDWKTAQIIGEYKGKTYPGIS
nr:hypothetical protein [uncultured Carboxylicivirga sp.]